jgi:16S rRNA (adenine1518-N6/adenine1519-N6)-dimethyltransferase
MTKSQVIASRSLTSPEGLASSHDRQPQGGAKPARALGALGLRARRQLSQSFLTNPAIAAAIAEAAELGPNDTVLEVGPGLGILTQHLVRAARRVVAIELDQGLAAALPGHLGSPPNLVVVQGDALNVDLGPLVEPPFVVVANLPYHVATPILFRLLFEKPTAARIVAMLQQEVADRIAAQNDRTTFLSAAIATVADARIVRRVAPGSFHPVPKVRSAVVRLDVRDEPAVPRPDVQAFLAFLRAGFTQPRKQLRNSLAAGLGVALADAAAIAAAANVDAHLRGEQLTLAAWIRLFRAWQAHEQAAA